VLASACQQAVAWEALGPQAHVAVSVNVSGRQLQEAGFVDDVQVCQAALATTGHTASWWTTSKVVGVAVLGAILTGALVIGSVVVVRRRRRLL